MQLLLKSRNFRNPQGYYISILISLCVSSGPLRVTIHNHNALQFLSYLAQLHNTIQYPANNPVTWLSVLEMTRKIRQKRYNRRAMPLR